MSKIIYDLSKLSDEVREQILTTPKFRKWFSEFPTVLFNRNNPKTIKGSKKGIRTIVLYGAPAKKSGVNMCAMSGIAQCDEPSLDEAGRGQMTSTQMSRLRKTLFMQQFWDMFLIMFKKEVIAHGIYCQKHDLIPACRPNGTWDKLWELVILDFMVYTHEKYGMKWYDYTKYYNRLIPCSKVYDLTFSYSGVKEFLHYVEKARKRGMRMAVVWRYEYQIPKSFMGMKVVKGDEDDATFLSPHNVVRSLYAKGSKAINDFSGFIQD